MVIKCSVRLNVLSIAWQDRSFLWEQANSEKHNDNDLFLALFTLL